MPRPNAHLEEIRAALVIAVFVFGVACRDVGPALKRTSPELRAALASAPRDIDEGVWRDVQAFYASRDQTFAWGTAQGLVQRAATALDALRRVDEHGLDPTVYGAVDLAARHAALTSRTEQTASHAAERARALADFDVRLTAGLLQAARHVATGRQSPDVIDGRWNAHRAPPDYVTALTHAIAEDVAGFFERVRPRHPEYASLREALASLRAQAEEGWATVPPATLKLGQPDPAVIPLRQRLAASGHLPRGAAAHSPVFDTDVQTGVRVFQQHYGLNATGALDAATLDAMNVPLDARVVQVAMNLERWRWLPDNLGARHLIVNIPHFHLIAREHGRTVMDIRTVVGTPRTQTPTFSDEMTHVVFSPYWNIPETIALEETAPAIARDPDYLTRNNLEVLDASGRVVPGSEVPWDDEEALRDLSFRQRPGPGNALGHVKFMFPNRHAVYIHDTPAHALFRRIGRAFSHGCVRIEEPEKLAHYVLRDQPEWTPEKIRAAMRAGEPHHVPLTMPIPVHVIYMTAWVDQRGGLHFADDVYGYDATQARAWSPVTLPRVSP